MDTTTRTRNVSADIVTRAFSAEGATNMQPPCIRTSPLAFVECEYTPARRRLTRSSCAQNEFWGNVKNRQTLDVGHPSGTILPWIKTRNVQSQSNEVRAQGSLRHTTEHPQRCVGGEPRSGTIRTNDVPNKVRHSDTPSIQTASATSPTDVGKETKHHTVRKQPSDQRHPGVIRSLDIA